jgi:Zn-dependent protease with chaperone function
LRASSFSGRLFGPGIAGAGVAATGHWQGGTLALSTKEGSFDVPASDLRIDAAGFNDGHLRLSWRSAPGEFAFFIEQAVDHEQFLKQAPQSVAPLLHAAGQRQCRTGTRFYAALLTYLLVLSLPLILLAVFLMHTDTFAGWVAKQVPIHQEEKIGKLILAQTRAQTRLIDSGPVYDAVKTIGTKLTAGSRYRYQWHVAEGEQVNAFAAPGGVVVVYTGLIAKAARPEELAGVLAHEVEHVEQRHGLKALIKNAGFGVLLSMVLGDWSGTAAGGWIVNLTELKFSRDAEMEADREGLHRMAQAGIAPEHMANFFAKIAREESKAADALSILSTHPSSPERTQALRQQIAVLPERRYEPLDIDWPAVQAEVVGHR